MYLKRPYIRLRWGAGHGHLAMAFWPPEPISRDVPHVLLPLDIAELLYLSMSFAQLTDACQPYPTLRQLDCDKIVLYISLLRHLKPQITFTHISTQCHAPQGLPKSIHDFLRLAIDVEDDTARILWTAVRDIAWSEENAAPLDMRTLIPIFLAYGVQTNIGK
jgi:hypothetical protein